MGQFSLNALDPIGATPLQDDTGKVGEPAESTIQFTSASSVNLLILAINLFGVGHGGAEVFAVHLGDVIDGDTLRACSLAFVKVRAVAEAFLVHLGDHGEHTLLCFDLMKTVRHPASLSPTRLVNTSRFWLTACGKKLR